LTLTKKHGKVTLLTKAESETDRIMKIWLADPNNKNRTRVEKNDKRRKTLLAQQKLHPQTEDSGAGDDTET